MRIFTQIVSNYLSKAILCKKGLNLYIKFFKIMITKLAITPLIINSNPTVSSPKNIRIIVTSYYFHY